MADPSHIHPAQAANKNQANPTQAKPDRHQQLQTLHWLLQHENQFNAMAVAPEPPAASHSQVKTRTHSHTHTRAVKSPVSVLF
jgi:hypothetical protein